MKKRIFTLLLVAMMLLSVFFACNKGGESGSESTGDGTIDGTEAPGTETSGLEIGVPEDLDLDGYEFRILTYQGGNHEHAYNHYWDPEETYDILSSAAIDRNFQTEGYLNCLISCIELGEEGGRGVAGKLYEAISTQEDRYDIANLHIVEGINGLLTSGALYDYRSMEYIDFEKPWYQQDFNDMFCVNDTQYLISGWLTNTNTFPMAMWFNKDLMADLQLEAPYQIVRDGGWTLDKYMEYMKNAYKDIDGVNGPSKGDQYGVSDHMQAYAYMCAGFGINPVEKQADGSVELNLYNEKIQNVVEKMNDFIWNNDYVCKGEGADGIYGFWADNRVLFNISLSAGIRTCPEGFELGILPTPKWDETQEHYITYNAVDYIVTPTTVEDSASCSAVIEVLSAMSYQYIKPAQVEQYIEIRTLMTQDDVDMYNILVEHPYIDFARYLSFSEVIKAFQHFRTEFFDKNNNDVASWAGSNETAIRTAFDMFYEYLGMEFDS